MNRIVAGHPFQHIVTQVQAGEASKQGRQRDLSHTTKIDRAQVNHFCKFEQHFLVGVEHEVFFLGGEFEQAVKLGLQGRADFVQRIKHGEHLTAVVGAMNDQLRVSGDVLGEVGINRLTFGEHQPAGGAE